LRIPGRHVVRLTYRGKADGDVVLDEEHDDFNWYSIDEMKAIPPDSLDIYFKELLVKGEIFI